MIDDLKKITIEKEEQAISYTTKTGLPFNLEELREFLELAVPLGPICDLMGERSIEDYTLTHLTEEEIEHPQPRTYTLPSGKNVTISSTWKE